MKNFQIDKLNMYQRLRLVFEKNTDKWSGIPYLSTQVTALNQYIQAIMNAAQQQLNDIKGFGNAKMISRHELEKQMYLCAGLVKAYAMATNNISLYDTVKINKSKLKLSRDKILSYDANDLLELINENAAALSSFGITEAVKNDFEQKINKFNLILNGPHDERKSNKEATAKIVELIAQTDNMLKNILDHQMKIFEENDDIFYSNYRLNRRVTHSPTIKLAMRIRVTDSSSKQAVAKALITIEDHKINRKTSEKGQIVIRNLKEGKHKIKITAQGYEPKIAEATREKGKTIIVNIEIDKINS